MKLVLGVSVWYKDRLRETDYRKMMENGITYVELSLDHVWPFRNVEGFEKMVRMIDDNGLRLGVHLPWRDILLLSPYQEVVEGSVEYLLKVGEKLSEYETEYAVLHVSSYEVLSSHDVDELIGGTIYHLKTLVKAYRENGIKLLLENLSRGPTSYLYTLKRLALQSDAMVCLDLGHLTASLIQNSGDELSEYELKAETDKWMRELGDRVWLLHLHGVVKVNKTLLEHYVLNDYYELYASIMKDFYEKKDVLRATLEIFYKDPKRRTADPRTLIRNAQTLIRELNRTR